MFAPDSGVKETKKVKDADGKEVDVVVTKIVDGKEVPVLWTGDKETKLDKGKPKGKNFKVEKKVVVKKNHVLPEARLAGYNMFGDNSKAKVEGRKYTNQPNFGMAVEIGARAGGLSKIFSASAGAKVSVSDF